MLNSETKTKLFPRGTAKTKGKGRRSVSYNGEIFVILPHKREGFHIRLPYDPDHLSDTNPYMTEWVEGLHHPGKDVAQIELTAKDQAWWDNNKYKVKFDEPDHSDHLHPTAEESREVFEILTKWSEQEGVPINADGKSVQPGVIAHGAENRTVDVLVRTIMAQGTSNENALAAQEEMREAYPYFVDGKWVKGDVPNYHMMRRQSHTKLWKVIKHAGLAFKRAQYILGCLNIVYEYNLAPINAAHDFEIPTDLELGQEPDTAQFVPGMLSLDLVCAMSKVDALNFFLQVPGIGVKTTICIMEFSLGFSLCAVDTHVMKLATWLGHLPKGMTNEIKAFNHLDGRYPNEVKHALHQLYWHHAQLCPRCKRKAKRDDVVEGEKPCPIEHLVTREGGMGSKTGRSVSPKAVKPEIAKRRAEQAKKVADKAELQKKKRATRVTKSKKSPSPTTKPKKVYVKKGAYYHDFQAYKDEAEAAIAGYELWEHPIDDNFASGSSHTKTKRVWRLKRTGDDWEALINDNVKMNAAEVLEAEVQELEAKEDGDLGVDEEVAEEVVEDGDVDMEDVKPEEEDYVSVEV